MSPAGSDPDLAVRQRFLPALAALLAVGARAGRAAARRARSGSAAAYDLVKTALLRAVSHDLRSPLTAVRTAVGALRNSQLHLTDADRDELLEAIDSMPRGSSVSSATSSISRGSKPAAFPSTKRSGRSTISRVRQSTRSARAIASRSTGEAPLVDVDGMQIQRVLANLIENALKYSPPDTTVTVRLTATRKEAIVRVIDHGSGLAEGEQERVFEPFYRRTGDAHSGAGLGLAIARGFAAANGGRLWAESKPGQGATFALALPVVEAPVGIGV